MELHIMSRFTFGAIAINSAVGAGASVLFVTDSRSGALFCGYSVLAGLFAFRELADEIVGHLKPKAPVTTQVNEAVHSPNP